MKNKQILNSIIFTFSIIVIGLIIGIFTRNIEKEEIYNKLEATILEVDDSKITLLDKDNNIYTLSSLGFDVKSGDMVVIKYAGVIDESINPQTIEVIDYEEIDIETDKNGIPIKWKDDGIFSDYYVMAFNKLKKLSLDEKIGQLLLGRYPENNAMEALEKYKLSGFVFYEKDFKNKTVSEVQNMMDKLQNVSNIPLLTAVDEEGGNVVRVSSNQNLSTEKFKSPRELYTEGGFEEIKKDTINKSELLYKLGLNLNLAPVVDVSTDPNDYIYNRTIGENTQITSTYAKTVIEASKKTNVSYTLKHFPGYSNNTDTHIGSSVDNRTYQNIIDNDIPPFKSGIEAGAEAVLISHNIVTSIDPDNPASLSYGIHNLLRNDLGFTGVSIVDDISMTALDNIGNPSVKAALSGNNLIITTNYEESFNELKNAVQNNTIGENIIDQLVFKILAWKYYKGLMIDIK